jgi:hypothetical protein
VRDLNALLLVLSTAVGCGSAWPSADLSAAAQKENAPTQRAPRLIGLVELPGVFGTRSQDGPPGQNPPIGPVALRVFARPGDREPFAVVTDGEQVRAAAHGYEESSAVVYARRGGWFEIGLRGLNQPAGWVAPADTRTFRTLEALLTDGLTYVTAGWDRRLFERPTVEARATLFPRAPENLAADLMTDEDVLGFWPAPDETGVIVLETRQVRGRLWLKVSLHEHTCISTSSGPGLATGWIPAQSAEGHTNVWFYSRGC